MEEAIRMEIKQDMIIVNKVRKFMQVTTISDISNANGTYIGKEWCHKGKKSSSSKIEWPRVGEPTEGTVKVWRKYIARLCSDEGNLRNYLGK